MKLPYFEEDFSAIEEDYFETEIEFHGKSVTIDLNLEEEISISDLEKVNYFLENLEESYQNAQIAIQNDFKIGGDATVTFYIQYVLDIFQDDLELILDTNNDTISYARQVLENLYLCRVGIYLDDKFFAIFDFSINHEEMNHIIAVEINKDRKVVGMEIES